MEVRCNGWVMGEKRPISSVEDMLIPAITLISGALVAYTAGVWTERRSGVLRPVHAGLFAVGLLADASGTYLMSRIAQSGTYETAGAASVLSQLMAITGSAALGLMALHLAWAIAVLLRGDAAAARVFHRFSLGVWALWLVPYVTGMASAMLPAA